jgi:5-methylcytosine-specific restriction endonuclease McrA
MANKWGIPLEVEKLVKSRDLNCVYCGIDFSIPHKSRKTQPSWEHIVNDIRINRENNIALCCTSCNASKGAKLLTNWLNSEYCKSKGISTKTVSTVVKEAISSPPTL